MPSGKTHDRFTWIFTPLVALGIWLACHDLNYSLVVSISFLFAGLMFSGDLDLKSVQYKRWGYLRWIWHPYQKWVRHRSAFSHGPVLGTITRLLYLSLWVLIIFGVWLQISLYLEQQVLQQQSLVLMHSLMKWSHQHPFTLIAILIGLWLGALSHTLADEIGSSWKRFRRTKRKKRNH